MKLFKSIEKKHRSQSRGVDNHKSTGAKSATSFHNPVVSPSEWQTDHFGGVRRKAPMCMTPLSGALERF